MSDHKDPLARATASWTQLLGTVTVFRAAMMRGDVDEATRLRQEAHDVLDAWLDLNGEAAKAVMDILGQ